MTNRERFWAVINKEHPDKIPCFEWATWWDKTITSWMSQGLPTNLSQHEIFDYFHLDYHHQFWINHRLPQCPVESSHGSGIIQSESDYETISKYLFSKDMLNESLRKIKQVKPLHDVGETVVWLTLEGFFWFPRTLFGIENHLYAFYDYPELMHRINKDQAEFSLYAIEQICSILKPDFMAFAEDMSYNHGPMISKELFDTFIKPYYDMVVPALKQQGIVVFIDTDGDVEPLIPWFQQCGIEGVLPLERQANVDVNRIQKNYPDWIMMGGYDKTIMHKGEAAMRAEFERILPAIRSGRYFPAVDHQTPPDVTIENYKIYVSLLQEYCTLR